MAKDLKINLGGKSFHLSEEDFTKGIPMNKEGKEVDMAMTVDATAEYATNSKEYFRRALIGEERTRSKFRSLLGVKDLVKLGTVSMSAIEVRPGATDPNFDNSEAFQKEFRVNALMAATSIDIRELELAFMSDQLAKGSNSFSDKFEFMNFFYSQLELKITEIVEKITFTGTTAANGVDGLEVQMAADTSVLKPTAGNGGVASNVTSTNIIDKLVQARDVITGVNDGAVRDMPDFTFIVAKNVYDALADSVSENKASGLYYIEGDTLAFQGIPIYKARGASADVIIATYWSNLLNIQDLMDEELGFNIVDFMKTTLQRKIGVRVDFKFLPSFVNPEEIYYHAV